MYLQKCCGRSAIKRNFPCRNCCVQCLDSAATVSTMDAMKWLKMQITLFHSGEHLFLWPSPHMHTQTSYTFPFTQQKSWSKSKQNYIYDSVKCSIQELFAVLGCFSRLRFVYQLVCLFVCQFVRSFVVVFHIVCRSSPNQSHEMLFISSTKSEFHLLQRMQIRMEVDEVKYAHSSQ